MFCDYQRSLEDYNFPFNHSITSPSLFSLSTIVPPLYHFMHYNVYFLSFQEQYSLFKLFIELSFAYHIHFLIHHVNIGVPPIHFHPPSFLLSSPSPLLICKLNYSILAGLLILMIEPITFWLDQCEKGNDLNGCRIKPHNHFNCCKRGKRSERRRRRRRRKACLIEVGK